MRELIQNLLRESIFDLQISNEDIESAYINVINEKRDNLITKMSVNSRYTFILAKDVVKDICGDYNMCETNSFNFVKNRLSEGNTNYHPVGGYVFVGDSFFPIEHWWVYDSSKNKHIDITPVREGGQPSKCYAGIINDQLHSKINKAKQVFDVNFFKGGHIYHNYI